MLNPIVIGLLGGCTLVGMMEEVCDKAPLIILTAVITEARAIAKELGIPCPAVGKPSITGRPRPLELHLIGIAARHLPDGLDRGSGIILAGLAGGLNPTLQIGDVVIEGWVGPPLAGTRVGKIISSDRIVGTPAEKAELFRKTGADAVDMESDAVQRAAGTVRFVHLRAISDSANDSIDPQIVSWVDDIGRPKTGRLVLALLKQPTRAAQLAILGGNVKLATRMLGEKLPKLLEMF